MRLNLPKWLGSTKRAVQTRTQRSRIDDQFEEYLREALKDQPYDVDTGVVLEDFVALSIRHDQKGGAVTREARKRVNFMIVARPSRMPVAAIMLTTQAYGRDRRQSPEVAADATTKGKPIIPVLYLNPHSLTGAADIAEVLKPHL